MGKNYTDDELIHEMKVALIPFSEMYEKWVQEQPEYEGLGTPNPGAVVKTILLEELRKAHFFCRHRDASDYFRKLARDDARNDDARDNDEESVRGYKRE